MRGVSCWTGRTIPRAFSDLIGADIKGAERLNGIIHGWYVDRASGRCVAIAWDFEVNDDHGPHACRLIAELRSGRISRIRVVSPTIRLGFHNPGDRRKPWLVKVSA